MDLRSHQLLVSQVLHDVVSPLTTVFAGLDFGRHDDEVWNFVTQAKNQLHHVLKLIRFFCGPLDSAVRESSSIISQWARQAPFHVKEIPEASTKLMAVLCFWAFKQMAQNAPHHAILTENYLQVVSSFLPSSLKDVPVLQGEKAADTPQESYAHYAALLACHMGLRLVCHSTPGQITVQWQKLN